MNHEDFTLVRTSEVEPAPDGRVVYNIFRDDEHIAWVGNAGSRWWVTEYDEGDPSARRDRGTRYRTRKAALRALGDRLAARRQITPANVSVAWLMGWVRRNYGKLCAGCWDTLVEMIDTNRGLPVRAQWAEVVDYLDRVTGEAQL